MRELEQAEAAPGSGTLSLRLLDLQHAHTVDLARQIHTSLLEDVDDAYLLPAVLAEFGHWRTAYSEDYIKAFGSISLGELVVFYARHAMLACCDNDDDLSTIWQQPWMLAL